MTNPVRKLPPSRDETMKRNALETLEELRLRVECGETLRFGVVECRKGGIYSTEFSSGANKREDAAMLMGLALRLMGFVQGR